MRILALVTEAFGGKGGIAQYNRDLTSAWAQAGHEVVVLPRHATGPYAPGGHAGASAASVSALSDPPLPGEAEGGVRGSRHSRESGNPVLSPSPSRGKGWGEGDPFRGVRQLSPHPRRLSYILQALWTGLTGKRFDVVFCGHIYSAPLAAVLSLLRRARYWLQIHGIEAWQRPSQLACHAANRADLVTAVSRYTRRKFLGWSTLTPENVRVLPNTVDPRFSPGPKRPDLVRRYGLEGKRVLLTVSRLNGQERYKGHDRVIQVLPALLRKFPDLRYLIAGDGDDRSCLESLASQGGVSDKVIFAGEVPDEDLPDIYRLADAYVMPSTGEGFGITFLEAAASGLPVVGGGVDGSSDALADGAIGVCVDPSDSSSLMAAVETAICSKREANVKPALAARCLFQNHSAVLVNSCVAP